jgi:hypothetical protein
VECCKPNRIFLKIAIKDRVEIAGSMLDTGPQGRVLAEIAG